ncbi:MAG: N-acetylmuramidase family protein [Muribaculaceae bacterium]|nr:N-acetylmuramidase family protein [Muribaculaceae bacterium]
MKLASLILLPITMWAGVACGQGKYDTAGPDTVNSPSIEVDSLRVAEFPIDSLPASDAKTRYSHLTEEDFKIVADELGVEVAAIKAVVEIEAGKQMRGFYAPGVPVVNFDRAMYRRHASKAQVRTGNKNAKVPSGLSGYALREWTQLTNARRVNEQGANMGTFWGMFQIGGFNYKMCGCKNVNEFVDIMSESEFSQLELFAKFITNSGMLGDLKAKNWAGFARKYNGASYARRGYHTRMAAAYNKFKKKSKL